MTIEGQLSRKGFLRIAAEGGLTVLLGAACSPRSPNDSWKDFFTVTKESQYTGLLYPLGIESLIDSPIMFRPPYFLFVADELYPYASEWLESNPRRLLYQMLPDTQFQGSTSARYNNQTDILSKKDTVTIKIAAGNPIKRVSQGNYDRLSVKNASMELQFYMMAGLYEYLRTEPGYVEKYGSVPLPSDTFFTPFSELVMSNPSTSFARFMECGSCSVS